MLLVDYKNVSIYQEEDCVLHNVNFHVEEGEFIYIIGRVGSGKSTLLKSIYGEVPLAEGEGTVMDYKMKGLKKKRIQELRRKLGIVFQDFQLLNDRTVYENLRFVLKSTGWKNKDIQPRIDEVLKQVGMENQGNRMPKELSGGEQQRIVIARALLNHPKLILADEPTGHLDIETGKHILQLLRSISEQGAAVIMSTHNLALVSSHPGIVYRCLNHELNEITDDFSKPFDMDELGLQLSADDEASSDGTPEENEEYMNINE